MADTPEARRAKKLDRLRHKEQMLGTLRVLAAENIAMISTLGSQLPIGLTMGPTPTPVNVNMAFDPLRGMLGIYFRQQQKYFDQLIKDAEIEIELMRKYDDKEK